MQLHLMRVWEIFPVWKDKTMLLQNYYEEYPASK